VIFVSLSADNGTKSRFSFIFIKWK